MSLKHQRATGPSSSMVGRGFLEEIDAGRIRWRIHEELAIWRQSKGGVVDVTAFFRDATTLQLAYVEPWDPDDPPIETLAHLTDKGEEIVIEARQRARNRKAKQ